MQITLEVKDKYINEFMSFLKLLDDKVKVKDSVKIEKKVKNENIEISKLSNTVFEKVWDNEEDTIYDKFIK